MSNWKDIATDELLLILDVGFDNEHCSLTFNEFEEIHEELKKRGVYE